MLRVQAIPEGPRCRSPVFAAKTPGSLKRRSSMIAFVRLSAALFAFALCTGAQAAVHIPNRPVRLIAGSPGSTADLSGRYIAQKLSERWGRQVVVDNRGSAGGIVGGEIVAKAPPDGHTLFVSGINTQVSAPLLFRECSVRSGKRLRTHLASHQFRTRAGRYARRRRRQHQGVHCLCEGETGGRALFFRLR